MRVQSVDFSFRILLRLLAVVFLTSAAGSLIAEAAPNPPKPKPATRPSAKDADLARRLLGQDGAERGDFARVISLMADAGERLEQKYDSSDETQGVQARALKGLDEAIAQARQNKSQSSSSSPKKAESRTAGKRNPSRATPKTDSAKPSAKS